MKDSLPHKRVFIGSLESGSHWFWPAGSLGNSSADDLLGIYFSPCRWSRQWFDLLSGAREWLKKEQKGIEEPGLRILKLGLLVPTGLPLPSLALLGSDQAQQLGLPSPVSKAPDPCSLSSPHLSPVDRNRAHSLLRWQPLESIYQVMIWNILHTHTPPHTHSTDSNKSQHTGVTQRDHSQLPRKWQPAAPTSLGATWGKHITALMGCILCTSIRAFCSALRAMWCKKLPVCVHV